MLKIIGNNRAENKFSRFNYFRVQIECASPSLQLNPHPLCALFDSPFLYLLPSRSRKLNSSATLTEAEKLKNRNQCMCSMN